MKLKITYFINIPFALSHFQAFCLCFGSLVFVYYVCFFVLEAQESSRGFFLYEKFKV
jgi:hypothetical protein